MTEGTIDLDPAHLRTVRAILREHVPGVRVRVFGSRARRDARRHSDLDLLLEGAHALPHSTLGILVEAFQESDLPMRVDVVDSRRTTPGFRAAIEAECVDLDPRDPLESTSEDPLEMEGGENSRTA